MDYATCRAAYEAGFRKTAAARGLDYGALVRTAVCALPGQSAGVRRARGLQKGAQAATLGRLIGSSSAMLGRGLSRTASGLGKAVNQLGGLAGKKAKRFLELLAGGNETTLKDYRKLRDWAKAQISAAEKSGDKTLVDFYAKFDDDVAKAFLEGSGGPFTIALPGGGVQTFTPSKDVSDELGKMIFARTLAGAGTVGGGYYAAGKYNENKNKSWLAKLLG